MTPLRARARKCSSAALAERNPSSRAISARVGGMPVSEMNRWMRRRIWVWRGVRSDIFDLPVHPYSNCDYIQIAAQSKGGGEFHRSQSKKKREKLSRERRVHRSRAPTQVPR